MITREQLTEFRGCMSDNWFNEICKNCDYYQNCFSISLMHPKKKAEA